MKRKQKTPSDYAFSTVGFAQSWLFSHGKPHMTYSELMAEVLPYIADAMKEAIDPIRIPRRAAQLWSAEYPE